MSKDESRCAERVYRGMWTKDHQCSRAGKLEHKGQLYCKQHYPPNVSERNKKRDDESQAEWRAEQLRWHSNKWSPKFLITLEEIASGELSDPVEHARAVLKEFHESKP